MEKLNRLNHSKLNFSCNAGTANVNIFNGNLSFLTNDLSLGLNSYNLQIYHVYDNQQIDNYNSKMGNNWKLNIQQYLIKSDTKDTNGNIIYKYIDESSFIHFFEKYSNEDSYDLYYDTLGTNLILYIKDEYAFIKDKQDNILYFDSNPIRKNLISITSGVNESIKKIIKYENDKIISFYDNRLPSRKIDFFYNEDDLLEKLFCPNNGKTINYFYDDKLNLISIKESISSIKKFSTAFAYQNKLLTVATDIESNSSLKFIYDKNNRVINVINGLAKADFIYSEPLDALFCGNHICNTNNYCGQKEKKFLGISINEDNFQDKEILNNINYSNNNTIIKNEKGIKTIYFFNKNGYTTSILEKDNTGYRTLFKQTGLNLPTLGQGTKINNSHSVSFNHDYIFSQDDNYSFRKYIKKDKNKDNLDYTISFWVKTNEDSNITVSLLLDYYFVTSEKFYNESKSSCKIFLDSTANNSWQYITIPFSIKNEKFIANNQLSSFYFNKLVSLNFENSTKPIEISNINISANCVPNIKLLDLTNDKNYLDLINVKKVIIIRDNNLSYTKEINNNFFFNENDISQIGYDLCLSKKLNKNYFTLTYNSGTKKLSKIKELYFVRYDTKIKFDCITSNDTLFDNNILYQPSYAFSSEPSTGKNRNYSYFGYSFENNNTLKYIFIHNKIFKYSDKAILQKTNETFTWLNKFNNEIKKIDEYNLIYEIFYDLYNNLIKSTTSNSIDDEKFVTIYEYDSNKECLISSYNLLDDNSIFCRKQFNFNPLFDVLVQESNNKEETIYKYNHFFDKLNTVELNVNGLLYGKNTLKYNKNGYLEELSPSENCKYTINYDRFGMEDSFFLNGTLLLTKSYDTNINKTSTTYYHSKDNIEIITTEFDNYGRIKKLDNNGDKLLSLSYEDELSSFKESPSIANIQKKIDYCSNLTYTYTYDKENNLPTEYNIESSDFSLNVKCINNNKLLFQFDNNYLNYEDEIKYDEDNLISPRIIEITNNNSYGNKCSFNYDNLGRLSSRFCENDLPTLSFSYKKGTNLKEKICNSYSYQKSYNSKDIITETNIIEQEYDGNGNITSISEKYNYNNIKNDFFYYEYDDIERLVHEKITGSYSLNRHYYYDFEGNISQIITNDIKETFTYENGRLIKINNDTLFQYDTFGNPISFKSKSPNMTWTRGTLLSKYNDINYIYNADGTIHKKIINNVTTTNYYDGNKLIAQKINNTLIRFFYDLDGIFGFKINTNDKYYFMKDAQGNVTGLYRHSTLIAKYIYDAIGNCLIFDLNGSEITNINHPALINPIRYKSLYYDTDSKFYYLDNRWYDPSIGRFISASSPEKLLSKANIIFGLNLYSLTTKNPLSLIIITNNLSPSLNFYYDGEYKSWWDRYGNLVLFTIGLVLSFATFIFTAVACGLSNAIITLNTLIQITTSSTIAELTLNAVIIGFQSALYGLTYWNELDNYLTSSFIDTLVQNFVSVVFLDFIYFSLINPLCFKEGTLITTKDGLKPIEELTLNDELLSYNQQTNQLEYKKITNIIINKTFTWCHIYIEDEEIICTENHPIFIYSKNQFVAAKDILPNDTILLSNGKTAKIKSVEIEYLNHPETTYNFEVEDFNTYFVSSLQILVHNRCTLGKNMEKAGVVFEEGDDAHHLYPQKFRDKFESLEGIKKLDIDAAENGYKLKSHKHKSGAWKYNNEWKKRLPNIKTIDEARSVMIDLMKTVYDVIIE